MDRLTTSKKSVRGVDLHDDDVTTVHLLVLDFLILVRHRRETTVKTHILVHGRCHQEVAKKEERNVRSRT